MTQKCQDQQGRGRRNAGQHIQQAAKRRAIRLRQFGRARLRQQGSRMAQLAQRQEGGRMRRLLRADAGKAGAAQRRHGKGAQQRALALGAVRYLEKPIASGDLLAEIERILS